MIYHSATYGDVSLSFVRDTIVQFMHGDASKMYEVVVGTDSQRKNGGTDFVTAIIVRRIGAGGIYFWSREFDKKQRVLKQRIFEEATRSLMIAQELIELFKQNGISELDVTIHVDVGTKGPTRAMITEVVSMIYGSGFVVCTKPHSYGASNVADRHT